MDKRNTERNDELPTVETPEDVAVLYSWANLHGAKYRDFSASRREYRAQLRHRAAEQAREQELRAQASAETAASSAEHTARQAEETAMSDKAGETEYIHQQALREAEKAARVASAERIEAARRAEAAAVAEAAARHEEREIAEANASARRQAAQYADSEVRRRQAAEANDFDSEDFEEVPGEISDPYTPQSHAQPRPPAAPQYAAAPTDRSPVPYRPASISPSQEPAYNTPMPSPPANLIEYAPNPQPAADSAPPPARRPQGYRPDDASGVRQIYRGPEFEASRDKPRAQPARQLIPVQEPSSAAQPPIAKSPVEDLRHRADAFAAPGQPSWKSPQPPARPGAPPQDRASAWSDGVASNLRSDLPPNPVRHAAAGASVPSMPPTYSASRGLPGDPQSPRSRPVSPFSQQNTEQSLADPTPRRRRQDAPGYKEEHPSDSNPSRRRDDVPAHRSSQQPGSPVARRSSGAADPIPSAPPASDQSGPAWLYATVPQSQAKPAPAPTPAQSSVADTLQHSRERVAARWYALKGVFEQPGQERPEPAPVRQKETRTPILAVFSMAGGVGKTSLVATLGRSLSSLGEKVLLTDTTSHGLLPFYFGASELRQGTVRTFSPPSGSTDAPIYLVSYDVEQKAADEAAQDALVEEITASSRGTHRVLLDLSVSSGWILRRMARLSPTILVPVAPDMNSVISLQSVEKFFNGIVDPEGRPLKLFYLLNQFDASLPLHLDIREVLRRQLGDRLLPFVIRRAPAVGEALAEGMTIVDYSPEAPVAEDYLNAATWLRTVAAPATAGFRNVRWSER